MRLQRNALALKVLTATLLLLAVVVLSDATQHKPKHKPKQFLNNNYHKPTRYKYAWCDKNAALCTDKTKNPGGGTTCCFKKFCKDLTKDVHNCGKCGHSCGYGQVCCKGKCVKLATNFSNCGKCGVACKANEKCVYGLCGYATVGGKKPKLPKKHKVKVPKKHKHKKSKKSKKPKKSKKSPPSHHKAPPPHHKVPPPYHKAPPAYHYKSPPPPAKKWVPNHPYPHPRPLPTPKPPVKYPVPKPKAPATPPPKKTLPPPYKY
eukprot:TRINITY_DN3059_c0_g1_i1.p2 TRINITY_DN3059_c0_g1~~TRINITY_DN3059_c0_g1_i1.p2  ORF type:complete len:261 (-),score=40.56 TRINITY_DN3059_c0_g1_i1:469-1251(-)